jgi:hypothetical protein
MQNQAATAEACSRIHCWAHAAQVNRPNRPMTSSPKLAKPTRGEWHLAIQYLLTWHVSFRTFLLSSSIHRTQKIKGGLRLLFRSVIVYAVSAFGCLFLLCRSSPPPYDPCVVLAGINGINALLVGRCVCTAEQHGRDGALCQAPRDQQQAGRLWSRTLSHITQRIEQWRRLVLQYHYPDIVLQSCLS